MAASLYTLAPTAEVEVEAKGDAEWHADDVVAAHVQVRHEPLPPAPHSHASTHRQKKKKIQSLPYGEGVEGDLRVPEEAGDEH